MSAFALGNFVGPTAAGFIVQLAGFPATTLLFFALYCVMFVVDLVKAVSQAMDFRHASDYEQMG